MVSFSKTNKNQRTPAATRRYRGHDRTVLYRTEVLEQIRDDRSINIACWQTEYPRRRESRR